MILGVTTGLAEAATGAVELVAAANPSAVLALVVEVAPQCERKQWATLDI